MRTVYLHLYNTGTGLSKRNKLGIHAEIEKLALECFIIIIDATLRPPHEKGILIQTVRRNTETLKHLIRAEYELDIIPEKTYMHQIRLIENVSMMATGWYKSIITKTQNHR